MRPGELADELERFARKLPARVKQAVEAESAVMLTKIKTERFRPWSPVPTPYGHVYDRSGDLKAALRSLVSDAGEVIMSRLFVDPSQPHEQIKASVSEFGKANIHATFGQSMTIPIGAALKGNGDRRYSGVDEARGDYDIFRRADKLLGRAKGLGDASVAPVSLFLLKKTVTVPPKEWAKPEVEGAYERIQGRIAEMFDKFTAEGEPG